MRWLLTIHAGPPCRFSARTDQDIQTTKWFQLYFKLGRSCHRGTFIACIPRIAASHSVWAVTSMECVTPSKSWYETRHARSSSTIRAYCQFSPFVRSRCRAVSAFPTGTTRCNGSNRPSSIRRALSGPAERSHSSSLQIFVATASCPL